MDDYPKPCGYPVMDCALGVYVTKCEDRIEELEAELLETQDRANALATKEYYTEMRAERAEAKLAKAAVTLNVIDALDPDGLVNGCSQSALIGLVLRMGELARATLAKLKGQNDE